RDGGDLVTPTGVVVASRSHCQTICERAKGIAVPAEPLEKLDVSWPGIRAGDMIAKLGLMGGESGPLLRRHSEKDYAVETRTIGGCLHEIYGRQALDRGGWPQNEREPRRRILERAEGDRTRATHDFVGVGRRNRCSAATRQSIIGPSAFRARILPHPTLPRKGRARRNSRDDRIQCARLFVSLCGQLY